VYVALWVPPGLIVGCESLLVPYGGERAGFLFAATAVGMLAGDVLMGRVIAPENRERWIGPTRWLLAVPWAFFVFRPGLVVACALVAVASVGYCSRLPLQERLVQRTATDVRGHALGLDHLGMMGMQGCGALIGGAIATALGSDSRAAATTITILAAASLLVTAALTSGLRRSRSGAPAQVLELDAAGMSRTPRRLRP
jgi:predicted MFS family arabinose efflux permease